MTYSAIRTCMKSSSLALHRCGFGIAFSFSLVVEEDILYPFLIVFIQYSFINIPIFQNIQPHMELYVVYSSLAPALDSSSIDQCWKPSWGFPRWHTSRWQGRCDDDESQLSWVMGGEWSREYDMWHDQRVKHSNKRPRVCLARTSLSIYRNNLPS